MTLSVSLELLYSAGMDIIEHLERSNVHFTACTVIFSVLACSRSVRFFKYCSGLNVSAIGADASNSTNSHLVGSRNCARAAFFFHSSTLRPISSDKSLQTLPFW